MKKTGLALIAFCIFVLCASFAFAADTVYKEATVSKAKDKNKTGFSFSLSGKSTAELKDGFIVLTSENKQKAKATATLASWEETKGRFVAEINIKITDTAGETRIYFNPAMGDEYEIEIVDGVLFVGGEDTGITLEEKEYLIHIIVDRDAEKNVEVMLDRVSVGGYAVNEEYMEDFEALLTNKDGKNELNITAYNAASQVAVGDTRVYIPGEIMATVTKEELETNISDVEVRFASFVKTEPKCENVKLVAEDGTEVLAAAVEGIKNDAGYFVGMKITPQTGLSKKQSHHVEINGLKGIFGEAVESKSSSFTIAPDDYEYKIKEVKLYSGISDKKKEITSLTDGFITIDVTAVNDGKLDGSVVIIAELYDSSDKLIYSGGVRKTVKKFGEASASFATCTKSAPAYYRIRLADSYKDKNDLTEVIEGGAGFEA